MNLRAFNQLKSGYDTLLTKFSRIFHGEIESIDAQIPETETELKTYTDRLDAIGEEAGEEAAFVKDRISETRERLNRLFAQRIVKSLILEHFNARGKLVFYKRRQGFYFYNLSANKYFARVITCKLICEDTYGILAGNLGSV